MRRPVLLATGLVLGLSATACTSGADDDEDPGKPARPAAVELHADLAEPLRVGVVVSLASAPGQGADVAPAAAGVQVAQHRYRLGGTEVELEVANDRGTAEGARAAVEALVDAGVSGIVAATTGDHLDAALQDASAAGTPVLLPYVRDTEGLPEGVWLTGPSDEAVDAALVAALRESGAEAPFVVTGDGVDVAGTEGAASAALTGSNGPVLAREVRRAFRAGGVDAVVVAASADSQGRFVAQLQGEAPELPILLTPEALAPGFAEALAAGKGTVADRFVTVGVDANDTTTLEHDAHGDRAAAYFAGLRLLAGDPDAEDLFGSVPFSHVAHLADTASHDAVVALAVAAAEAGSVDAEAVRGALDGLVVDGADGLAGPDLDFGDSAALPDEAVVVLHATTQDPGVRPASVEAGQRLHWFAATPETG